MLQLADSPVLSVSGIHSTVFAKLKAQAAIQIKSKLKSQKLEGSIDSDRPEFEILLPSQNEKKGLSSLPPHSSMDIFFDIEGFPLDEGELEYLWGNTYFDEQGNRQFKDFRAHNRKQEKQCFQGFIRWVYGR